jgi:hypothetical protein
VASGIYVDLTHIPTGLSDPRDAVQFGPIAATTATFLLSGGQYGVSVNGTFVSVTLQIQGADGTTFLTAMTAFSANGFAVTTLPAGTYKLAIA